jgi:subtilase family serine protease
MRIAVHSKLSRRVTGTALVIGLATTGMATWHLSDAAAAGLAPGAPATLGSGANAEVAGLVSTGVPSPSTRLTVGVALSNPNLGAEVAYYRAVYTQGSPDYHRFLTPSQVAQRFGVDQARSQGVASWLQSGGLGLGPVSAARDYVTGYGTVAQVESLFHVTLLDYSKDGTSFVANTAAPSVPANFGISAVLGLDTGHRFATPSAPRTAATPTPSALSPQDMWSLYNQPAGNQGQGQTMAVFAWGNTEDKTVRDLRTFEDANTLPLMPVNVVDLGQHDRTDHSQDGAEGE